ncbi:MAG: hypothetical protein M1839_002837, partial [Geoglossum umbratile]
MDPLSITAGIIAVLQITGAVISTCYDYRCGVKSKSRDVARLTNELISLRNVLERLLALVESEEFTDSAVLEKRLSPASGWRAMGKVLLWPLAENDVMKSLESIKRFQTTLHTALTADQMTMTRAIQNDVEQVSLFHQAG